MIKSIIQIFLFLVFLSSCSSDIEKGVEGLWTIDNIYDNNENAIFKIGLNTIFFESDGTCTLPVALSKGNESASIWEIIKNNDGKYYIQFKTENLMFKGTHPIRFENNQKDHMLMMIIESDSLYVKSRKGLTNYRKNLLLIKYLEKETY